MTRTDHRGDAITGANDKALALYETALSELQRYVGTPFANVDAAIAEAPAFTMAHVLKAHLFLSGTELPGVQSAREAIAAAKQLKANERERLHIAAAEALIEGEYERAEARFEDILVDYPRDVLALQMGHLFDFYRGDARNLRDRVARVMHAWSSTDPGYHALLGMYAFGLEECGQYGKAEEVGCSALALEPRDNWAHHAVAHVLEMEGRRTEGIKWMATREAHWANDSFFSIHNWWHYALYFLDEDKVEDALRLYDGPIRQSRSTVMLDMIDASGMLWRMHLRGIELGRRWQELADDWTPMAEDGLYAFNDVHAMMAFVGANREDMMEKVIASMRRQLERGGSNQMMTRDVGLPVALALRAFGRGRYGETVELLRDLRPVANRFGGSHAQRDLLDLTLIEAARRAGQTNLLRNLTAERIAAKRHPAPLALRYREAA